MIDLESAAAHSLQPTRPCRRGASPQSNSSSGARKNALRACVIYFMTTNVEAIRRLFQVEASNDRTGNLPSMPGTPDYGMAAQSAYMELCSPAKRSVQ